MGLSVLETSKNKKTSKRKIFHLSKIDIGIPMYKIKEFSDEVVKGNFYESELQRVKYK